MKKQRGFADVVFMVAVGTFLFLSGAASKDEPHYSFRDGCKVQTVSAGGYNTESYAHCATLPRVYSGKAWAAAS